MGGAEHRDEARPAPPRPCFSARTGSSSRSGRTCASCPSGAASPSGRGFPARGSCRSTGDDCRAGRGRRCRPRCSSAAPSMSASMTSKLARGRGSSGRSAKGVCTRSSTTCLPSTTLLPAMFFRNASYCPRVLATRSAARRKLARRTSCSSCEISARRARRAISSRTRIHAPAVRRREVRARIIIADVSVPRRKGIELPHEVRYSGARPREAAKDRAVRAQGIHCHDALHPPLRHGNSHRAGAAEAVEERRGPSRAAAHGLRQPVLQLPLGTEILPCIGEERRLSPAAWRRSAQGVG